MAQNRPTRAPGRRAEIRAAIEAATGIDEAMIRILVDRFYERVREDDLLAPVFAQTIADWDGHLEQMYAFWSSVALQSGRYHGRPMPKHVVLDIGPAHFRRWLAMFRETARETCPPAAAARFIERAEAIAASMQDVIEASRTDPDT